MKRLLAITLLFGCGEPDLLPPAGQVRVHFDTDAPVPPGSGKVLGPDDPAPLFDTLEIAVYEPGQSQPCADCVREVPIDSEQLASGGISMGIAPDPGTSGYRVRARLFPRAWIVPCNLIPEGETRDIPACDADPLARVPHPATVISRTVRLPGAATEGIDEITVLLETDTVGAPQGSPDAPGEALVGTPAASRVGTWPGAARAGCSAPPRADEACVPSGAFWQGNARPTEWLQRVASPRLVVLSPFFMKTAEVTVGECRAVEACAARALSNAKVLPGWCNYKGSPGPNDAEPLNCLVQAGMESYCAAWGGELPSAAQLEYAGRGTVGSIFVWGDDPPTCADAMWGRSDENTSITWGPCYDESQGPYPAGSGQRDRLVLPTGTIVDLAGNLEERARDAVLDDCTCPWPDGVLRDPVCRQGAASYAGVGGCWSYGAISLAPGLQLCAGANFVASMHGFRCTRPGL
jgi:formylglycine-generating enzyme required for sulfatase activity